MTALSDLDAIDTRRPRLFSVQRQDLQAIYNRELHHVFFRMQTPVEHIVHGGSMRNHLGISIEELGKCLHWIPGNSVIVLGCAGGFPPVLRSQISSLHTDRDLYLLEEDDGQVG